jgi:hypothetical protein
LGVFHHHVYLKGIVRGDIMYCISCGTELPDNAVFCSKCGKSQKISTAPEIRKSETCEIIYVLVQPVDWESITRFKFVAEAVGPNGKDNILETVTLGIKGNVQIERSYWGIFVDELIDLLLLDGWQPSESRGENWWSYRFRRNWSPEQIRWEVCEIGVEAAVGFWQNKYKFVAYIVGKTNEKGKRRVIAESPFFDKRPNHNQSKTKSEIVAIYNSFINQLQEEGWEQYITKTYNQVDQMKKDMFENMHLIVPWARRRFRRRIK